MDLMNVECPHCHSRLRFPYELDGQDVHCTRCNELMTLPELPRGHELIIPPPQPPKTVLPPPLITSRPAVPEAYRRKTASDKNRFLLRTAGAIAGAISALSLVVAFVLLRPRAIEATAAAPARSQRPTVAPPRRDPAAEQKRIRELKRAMDVASVDANEFAAEFVPNALAATRKYEGRMIVVRGIVALTMHNNQGLPLVMLDSSPLYVRVFLADKDVAQQAELLRAGQRVKFLATFGGQHGNAIDLDGAVFCDDDLERSLHPR